MFVTKKNFAEQIDTLVRSISSLKVDMEMLKKTVSIRTAIKERGAKMGIVDLYFLRDGVNVTDAISLILDHLGLEIEKVPEPDRRYRLVEKEKE